MPLTMRQKERILRDVSLGVAPPDDEPEEAREWRERMETQVDEMREQGMENMIPFDPCDEEAPGEAKPPAPPLQSSPAAAVPAPAAAAQLSTPGRLGRAPRGGQARLVR